MILCLLLAGCSDTPQYFTPSEKIWHDAYCGYTPMSLADYERVHRWGEAHVRGCQSEGVSRE